MDAVLGLSGADIEDFEDDALLSGLTIEAPGGFDFPRQRPWVWDGIAIGVTVGIPDAVTISFGAGTSTMGIGILYSERVGHTLQINGEGPELDFTAFPEYDAGEKRNLYIRIDTEPGDPLITSVAFRLAIPENLGFDHVALGGDPVSVEPRTWGGIRSLYR
jgi:hypothetical protein